MTYKAKEIKFIYKFSNKLSYIDISIQQKLKSSYFYKVGEELRLKEKLWHPYILLKYFLILAFSFFIVFITYGGAFPIIEIFSNRFKLKEHPEAKLVPYKELNEAITKFKEYQTIELNKDTWV